MPGGIALSASPGLPGTATLFGALSETCTPTPCNPKEILEEFSYDFRGEVTESIDTIVTKFPPLILPFEKGLLGGKVKNI